MAEREAGAAPVGRDMACPGWRRDAAFSDLAERFTQRAMMRITRKEMLLLALILMIEAGSFIAFVRGMAR